MSFIEWTADLNTGIDVIDAQHRRIVDYINRLQIAIDEEDRQEMEAVFKELVDYTVTHFTFEEGLQDQAGYEFRGAHKKVHKLFVRKLEEHQLQFQKGDTTVAVKVNAMLRSWLVNHIKSDDADYVESVKAVIGSGEKSGWIARSLRKLFG